MQVDGAPHAVPLFPIAFGSAAGNAADISFVTNLDIYKVLEVVMGSTCAFGASSSRHVTSAPCRDAGSGKASADEELAEA